MNTKFFIIILIILKGFSFRDINKTKNLLVCNGTIFNQVYYEREVLFENFGKPYNLLLHKYSGILFFSHTVETEDKVDFALQACDVEKRICNDIGGIRGGYAVAYDLVNDEIYFGGHDGIYKYSFHTQSAEFFSEEGKSIWGLFIRKHFYYIEYPDQKLYVYQDDRFVSVAESFGFEIDNFFISKHLDVYFSNRTALYKVNKLEKVPYVLEDAITVRQITEDHYGDIYFMAADGIYMEHKPFYRVKKVAYVNNGFGVTFDDNDNVIFSDVNTVNRLLPSRYEKLCYDAITRSQKSHKLKDFLLIS